MLARATRVALLVGTILVAINQGDAVLRGPLGFSLVARIGLTFAVPFLVSIYSMLGMVPELRPGQRSPKGGAYRCRNRAMAHQGEAIVSTHDRLPPCPQCGDTARWIPSHD